MLICTASGMCFKKFSQLSFGITLFLFVAVLNVSNVVIGHREIVRTSNAVTYRSGGKEVEVDRFASYYRPDVDVVVGSGGSRQTGRRRVERQATAGTPLNSDQIAESVDAHNYFRRLEPASDMQFMIWNSYLADMATEWSSMCIWAHGQPLRNASSMPFNPLGQNLYLTTGASVNITLVLSRWYSEKPYYNYSTRTCAAGQMCGHYTQVVWAQSREVGCGQFLCPSAIDPTTNQSSINAWIFTCNYGPAGNYDTMPYTIGQPCTSCVTGQMWCDTVQPRGLCRRDCNQASDTCQCQAACQNQGVPDCSCQCQCPVGYGNVDCSMNCSDYNSNCGSAWPSYACSDKNFGDLIKSFCFKTCNLCTVSSPGAATLPPPTACPMSSTPTTTPTNMSLSSNIPLNTTTTTTATTTTSTTTTPSTTTPTTTTSTTTTPTTTTSTTTTPTTTTPTTTTSTTTTPTTTTPTTLFVPPSPTTTTATTTTSTTTTPTTTTPTTTTPTTTTPTTTTPTTTTPTTTTPTTTTPTTVFVPPSPTTTTSTTTIPTTMTQTTTTPTTTTLTTTTPTTTTSTTTTPTTTTSTTVFVPPNPTTTTSTSTTTTSTTTTPTTTTLMTTTPTTTTSTANPTTANNLLTGPTVNVVTTTNNGQNNNMTLPSNGTEDSDNLFDQTFVITIIAVLSVVGIFLVFVIIVICVVCRRLNKQGRIRLHESNPQTLQPKPPPPPEERQQQFSEIPQFHQAPEHPLSVNPYYQHVGGIALQPMSHGVAEANGTQQQIYPQIPQNTTYATTNRW